MVLPLQISAASASVHFDSIFVVTQHSVVSSVPFIVLHNCSSLSIRVSVANARNFKVVL